jgi:hypothetical protein
MNDSSENENGGSGWENFDGRAEESPAASLPEVKNKDKRSEDSKSMHGLDALPTKAKGKFASLSVRNRYVTYSISHITNYLNIPTDLHTHRESEVGGSKTASSGETTESPESDTECDDIEDGGENNEDGGENSDAAKESAYSVAGMDNIDGEMNDSSENDNGGSGWENFDGRAEESPAASLREVKNQDERSEDSKSMHGLDALPTKDKGKFAS